MIISIVFGFIIPACLETIPFLLSHQILGEKLLILMKIVQKGFGWTGYFILGAYLHKHKFSKRDHVLIFVLGFIAFLSSIVIFRLYAYGQGYAVNEFYDNISITVLSECIAIFELAKQFKFNIKERYKKVIYNISKYTFGIYLVHMLILYVLDQYWISVTNLSPGIYIPLSVVLVFAISAVISMVLNQIPVLKKYIV